MPRGDNITQEAAQRRQLQQQLRTQRAQERHSRESRLRDDRANYLANRRNAIAATGGLQVHPGGVRSAEFRQSPQRRTWQPQQQSPRSQRPGPPNPFQEANAASAQGLTTNQYVQQRDVMQTNDAVRYGIRRDADLGHEQVAANERMHGVTEGGLNRRHDNQLILDRHGIDQSLAGTLDTNQVARDGDAGRLGAEHRGLDIMEQANRDGIAYQNRALDLMAQGGAPRGGSAPPKGTWARGEDGALFNTSTGEVSTPAQRQASIDEVDAIADKLRMNESLVGNQAEAIYRQILADFPDATPQLAYDKVLRIMNVPPDEMVDTEDRYKAAEEMAVGAGWRSVVNPIWGGVRAVQAGAEYLDAYSRGR